MKHTKILSLVYFEIELDTSIVFYTQAVPGIIHNGVYDPFMGRDVNIPHNPFVDHSHHYD